DHVGVRPDILVLAKGLASGLPISATVADTSVMNWPAGAHANTFGGSPLACAAALATLGVVEDEGLIANATTRGRELLEGLNQLTDAYPGLIENPRGLGLLAAIDLAGDLETAEQRRNELVQEAFRSGLLILPAGRRAIRLIPPLIVSSADVQRAIGLLGQAMNAVSETEKVAA
ncbi:MAG TPA: aminotransferase class III-fold pyridoxal phosphate-dependent enzyme, partial [Chloroflexota bacterium]|nr:aminotransferase class III-fold pyridoxal phosphate-dependent enzyme [Chloroflexota bacterium]